MGIWIDFVLLAHYNVCQPEVENYVLRTVSMGGAVIMSEEVLPRKLRLSSFQIIILGFAGVILVGEIGRAHV